MKRCCDYDKFFFFFFWKEDKFELRITKLMRINFAAAGNRTRDLQISESERENDRIKGWVAHNRAPNHAPWLVAPSLACSGRYFSHFDRLQVTPESVHPSE